MDILAQIVNNIKNFISNDFFIAFVLLCGIWFSIRLIFPQFRLLRRLNWSLKDNSNKPDEGISSFRAFMTALGSRVGVGNIAGVATAIAFGGPGAIFWIWIFGIFGSAIAFLEGVLGQAYKIKVKDEYIGGAVFYLWWGFKHTKISRPFAIIFAAIAIVSFGILIPGVQSNTIVNSIQHGFGLDKYIVVIVASIVIAAIIWGGIKSISSIEAYLTPFKCIAYLLLALVVIIYNYDGFWPAISTIFESAFNLKPMFGGIVGEAIIMGVRRGIFSTDVIYGPGGSYAAAARCDHPVKQGILQSLTVLMATLLICTATALMIIQSDALQVIAPNGEVLYCGSYFPETAAGAEWVQAAITSVPFMASWGGQLLAFMIVIFAIGAIIGDYYIIEVNLRFFLGRTSKIAIVIAKIVYITTLVISGIIDAALVWDICDIGTGLLGWINLIAVLGLSPKVVKIVKDFTNDIKNTSSPKFNAEKYGIDDPTGVWKNE